MMHCLEFHKKHNPIKKHLNLVPQATVDELVDAYRSYRERTHHLSLENAGPVVPGEEFREIRAKVSSIWNFTMIEGRL